LKIKAVCDATGLTDRAIRYYIDEELLSPAYTENYLGRKSFDFSQTDIQQLKDIAILRKFCFSIPELRQMLLHPETILPTARQLQLRMETSVSETQSHLAALSRLDHNRSYTLWELADFLSKPVSRTPLPPEDSIARPKILSYYLKKIIIFLVTWYPIVLTAIVILHYIRWYQYPVFNGMTVLLLGIALLPTELILLFSKLRLKPRAKKIIMPLLLTGCLLYMPITYYTLPFCITSSATTNHHNYRMFDAICPANRDGIFQDLFPAQPVFSDIEYHYLYSETVFGDSCDIYAQWTLKPSEFASEIDRVQGLFDRNSAENITLLTTQAGAYRCLIWYTGTAPFKTANEDYTYHIFAYNEQTLTVRYIYCWSELNGADQPYYLSLQW
jgi:DNA-binding transcriptional MerR regulator